MLHLKSTILIFMVCKLSSYYVLCVLKWRLLSIPLSSEHCIHGNLKAIYITKQDPLGPAGKATVIKSELILFPKQGHVEFIKRNGMQNLSCTFQLVLQRLLVGWLLSSKRRRLVFSLMAMGRTLAESTQFQNASDLIGTS